MKKNAVIYIDDTTAQVTKAFEKQARIFGTEEFKLWREYRKEFPEAMNHEQKRIDCQDRSPERVGSRY